MAAHAQPVGFGASFLNQDVIPSPFTGGGGGRADPPPDARDPGAFLPFGFQGTDGINSRANGSGPSLGRGTGGRGRPNPINRLAISAASDNARLAPGLSDQLNALEGISNRVGEGSAVAAGRRKSGRLADVDAGTFERQTRGLDLSERQKTGARNKLGLTRAISEADRVGDIRRGFTNRAKAADSVGGAFADVFRSQELGAETALANEAGQDIALRASRDATSKVNRNSLIGTVGGLALSALAMFSSEAAKDKQGEVPDLLGRLKNVRVERWNYKGEGENHIGPFAEEFNNEFGTGTKTPDRINLIDVFGITLGSVKELNAKIDRMEARG